MKKRRRPKVKVPNPIFDALISSFEKRGWTEQARRLKLESIWREAVGERIASHTRPDRLTRKTLVIKADHSAWQQELTMMSRQLIKTINEAMGEEAIKDLKVIAGTFKDKDPKPIAPPPSKPLSDTEKAEVKTLTTGIQDEEIRERFNRLIEAGKRAGQMGED